MCPAPAIRGPGLERAARSIRRRCGHCGLQHRSRSDALSGRLWGAPGTMSSRVSKRWRNPTGAESRPEPWKTRRVGCRRSVQRERQSALKRLPVQQLHLPARRKKPPILVSKQRLVICLKIISMAAMIKRVKKNKFCLSVNKNHRLKTGGFFCVVN